MPTKECRDICEFVSWIEKRNKVYFLTSKQLFSEKGLAFIKENGISPDDYCGHGTIRKWYGIDSGDGVDKENTDFSSLSKFPDVIVKAIKAGEMRRLGRPEGLLKAPAWKAYQEAKAPAWKAYQEATATAEKAYQEATATAEKAYQEAKAITFWDLFAMSENRAKAWR